MRLSEAIRLGSLLRPQGFRALFTPFGASCALGAALEATGANFRPADSADFTFTLDALLEQRGWRCLATYIPAWREVLDLGIPTPRALDVLNMITALNDYAQWTRERIADWVESIENAHPELLRREDAAVNSGQPNHAVEAARQEAADPLAACV
jgi:hypothetical protein